MDTLPVTFMTPSRDWLYAIAGGAVAAILLSMHILPWHPAVGYTAAFIFASAVYIALAFVVFKIEISRQALVLLLATGIAVRLSFISSAPIGSDDVYRYFWDGKVQSAGINPYRYAPNAAELSHLRSDLLPAAVNHPDMKTLYLPLSQWFFAAGYFLSGEEIWGIKLLLAVAELLTIAGIFALLTRLSVPPKFILLYALCPLPIVEFALDAHLDGLGLPFLVGGLALWMSKRKTPALFLLGLSLSVKPVALVALPVLFLSERGAWSRVRTIALPIATAAVLFIPYMVTANPFEALETFSKHWTFNGVVFEALDSLFNDNQRTRLYCALLLGLALIPTYFNRRPTMEKISLAVMLLLLFSPVVHPWYVAWLSVLVPAARRWSGIAFTAVASLTSFTILTYKLTGTWTQYPLVLAVEYLPVIILLIIELRRPASGIPTPS